MLKQAVRPVLVALVMIVCVSAGAIDLTDTRLVADPAVSVQHIAFAYAGDLWIADHEGNNLRRLTTHEGEELRPRFSPDGSMLAFSGSYDGNLDVFLVPVAGGEPTRLTWHPGDDLVQGFTPDGASVLFTSGRGSHTRRFEQLYTVPASGGFPEMLPVPNAAKASLADDGKHLAYTPLAERFRQWKGYRGGTATRIWVLDLADLSVNELPQPESRCNDTDPMWIDGLVYFVSDRNGELNLFRFDPAGRTVQQLTHHDDFPIISASAGAGKVIYEQAGYLHLFDPATASSHRLQIGVATDLVETRTHYASGERYLRTATISPTGARAAFGYRGEIVTVPAKHGSVRNLTTSPGVHERHPAWSPDGMRVAYFSDADGEYSLHVQPHDGRGEVARYPLDGAGFYQDIVWSPDGKRISFTDCSWSLWVLELASGHQIKVASEPQYGPSRQRSQMHTWSPDSRWLAYTRSTETYMNQVFLYSVEQDRSFPLSDGLSDVREPAFDSSGDYLYLSASTDAGPVRTWFAVSANDMETTASLYLVVLSGDTPSPLARKNDEEKPAAAGEKGSGTGNPGTGSPGAGSPGTGSPGTGSSGPAAVKIDLEGLSHRVLALPLERAGYRQLQAGKPGQLYYLKHRWYLPTSDEDDEYGKASLCRFDLESRQETVLLEQVEQFLLAADHQHLLVKTGNRWLIADAAGSIDSKAPRLATDQISVRVEPRAEWRQIFDEAWRINRDYFYDPGMHGADWPAMREHYAVFLPHLTGRRDLNRVIQWMCSELSVGHHRVGGGDLPETEEIPGGLLGADLEIANGRYRFAKVFGGLNWSPELRSPLTEPGVDVKAGDYLLAVRGEELLPPANPYAPFERTAGEIVDITVASDPAGSDRRTVQVVPIDNDRALRNRDWVEGNIKKVDEATEGRVAYVYVPNTAGTGHTYFKRYFFPQANRQAIIIDERYNAGGQVADYYIDILRRPLIAYWATRYGADLKTPLASIQGPKVMIIDETAGSGGDLLPWMFRKLELGPLIGRRTWGGLVGILGFPVLMDGGRITAPNLAIWTEQGFVVENQGVPPDIEVEQWPAEVMAGHDPQLERAIDEVMRQLAADPPTAPRRPPFPVRARRP